MMKRGISMKLRRYVCKLFTLKFTLIHACTVSPSQESVQRQHQQPNQLLEQQLQQQQLHHELVQQQQLQQSQAQQPQTQLPGMFLVQEDGSAVSVNDDQLLSFAGLSAGGINTDVAGTVQTLAGGVIKLQQRLEYCIKLQEEMLRQRMQRWRHRASQRNGLNSKSSTHTQMRLPLMRI